MIVAALLTLAFIGAELLGIGETNSRGILLLEYVALLPAIVLVLRNEKAVGRNSHRVERSIALGLILAGFVALTLPLAWALDLGVYQADESVYLFQARLIEDGQLYLQDPPEIAPADLHYTHEIIHNGKWFGKYPIGWPALLSIGMLTGAAWLVNPLLGLVLLWLTHAVGREVLSPAQASWGALLLLLSPVFSLNTIGFMSHVLAGVLVAAATLFYFKYAADSRRLWMIGLLACIAAGVVVRPFTMACVGVVLGGSSIFRLRRDARRAVEFCGVSLVFAGLAATAMAAQHYVLTGDFWVSPYGLGPDGDIRELAVGSDNPLRALIPRIGIRVVDTLAASFPLLLPLALYALWRRRDNRDVWLLAAIFGVLIVGHWLNPVKSGSPVGERFYFEGLFAAALLAAEGWKQVVSVYAVRAWLDRGLFCALALIAVAMSAKYSATEIWSYRRGATVLADAAEDPPFAEGVVFVEASSLLPDSHRYNLNRPGDRVLYLPDPGPVRRDGILPHVPWNHRAVLRVDPATGTAIWTLGESP